MALGPPHGGAGEVEEEEGGSPFRGDLAQNRAHPRARVARAHPAANKKQGPRVRGAYRGGCGWISAPTSWRGGASS
jgi:hypothetical protein